MALLEHAASPYLSKLNSWFDQTVDRVSELFTRRIRLVTALVALGLAVFLQLDSVGLINRLSVDDQLRNSLVEKAVQKEESWRQEAEAGQARLAQLTGAGSGEPAEPAKPEPLADVRRTIEEVGVVSLPRDFGQWSRGWWEPAPRGGGFRWPFLLGVLLSAALLSLGAPFWYATLGNLLRMRSLIARKDEAQRAERQTTQVPGIVTTLESPRQPG